MTPARLAALLIAVLAALVTAPAATAGPPGKWTRITDYNSEEQESALARTPDGTLHVFWGGSGRGISEGFHRLVNSQINPDGTKPAGFGFAYAFDYPKAEDGGAAHNNFALVRSGQGLRAFFTGVYPNHPLNGVLATATSNDGVTWSDAVAVSASSNVYPAVGLGAAVLPNGTPITVWGDYEPGNAAYHFGLDPNEADVPFGEQDGVVSGPNVAIDAVTGQAVLAWNDIEEGTVWAASLFSPNDPVPVPFADAPDGTERVALTGRIPGRAGSGISGGGVYLGYLRGTNVLLSRPAVWRVGSDSAMTLSSMKGARFMGVTAAPNGRIWAFWARTSPSRRIYATRSNTNATAFGPISTHSLPEGAFKIYSLEGEGSLGPLDLLALVETSHDDEDLGNWHQQIRPRLKLDATVQGRGAAFKVLDAGQPVNNAKVLVAGKSGFTDEKGRVTFRGLPEGTHRAKAKKSGYERAERNINVEGR